MWEKRAFLSLLSSLPESAERESGKGRGGGSEVRVGECREERVVETWEREVGGNESGFSWMDR